MCIVRGGCVQCEGWMCVQGEGGCVQCEGWMITCE